MMTLHRLGMVTRGGFLAVGVTTAVLIAAVGPSTAVAPPPATHVVQLQPGVFTTSVTGAIAGWNWLRSATYSDTATYTFSTFDPAVLSFDHKLGVYLAPLVTNKTSGGAGWGARIHVAVTYGFSEGSKTWTYDVTLTNPFPLQSTLSSGGTGYQTYGSLTLAESKFAGGPGSLKIQITRDSTYITSGFHPHVAVNAGAVSIWYRTP